jgi:hypothetical protein
MVNDAGSHCGAVRRLGGKLCGGTVLPNQGWQAICLRWAKSKIQISLCNVLMTSLILDGFVVANCSLDSLSMAAASLALVHQLYGMIQAKP